MSYEPNQVAEVIEGGDYRKGNVVEKVTLARCGTPHYGPTPKLVIMALLDVRNQLLQYSFLLTVQEIQVDQHAI
jgi:hypothetical protein